MSERAIEAAARSDAQFDGRDFDGLSRLDRERYLARSRAALAAAERVGEYRADYEPLTQAEIDAPIPEMDALLKNSKPAAQRVAGEDDPFTLGKIVGKAIGWDAAKRDSSALLEKLALSPGKEPDLGWLQGENETIRERRPSDSLDDLCAACGEPRREHVTPGGTRYGPTTLCGVFIPRERVSPGKVTGD